MLLTSTDHVDFGPTAVNRDNSATIQLFNAGTALNIFSAVSDDPRFTVSGVPASLPTAGSASFTVTFAPLTAGAFSGTISINHDGVNGSPLVIAVEGLGYEVPIVTLPWNEPFNAAGFDSASWEILFSGNPEVIDSSGTTFTPFPHALPSAPYMLEISGGENFGDLPDEVSTGFFDLSGAANLALTFQKSEHDLEIGEYVLISYLADNGQWKTLDSLAGTDNGFGLFEPFTRVELGLPADAYHTQFRLRFSASPDMLDTDEYYFDNFTLEVGNLLSEPRNLVGQARDGAADLAWEPPPALLNQLLQHLGDGLSKVSPTQKNAAHSSAENPGANAEEILNLIRYRVYRSEDGSNFSVIDSVEGVITMFSDSNVVNGNTYWYQVTAVHNEGESDPSNAVPVTPQALPGNLLLFESFEGSFLPPGWHKFNFDGGTIGWTKQLIGVSPVPGWNGGILTGPPNGGTAVAFCTWYTGGPENFRNDQWLVTPQITNVVEDDFLHFWLRYWPNSHA
ncbi:MAG: choice-of-anchor D domain-containing protein, partial [bacterium]